VKTPAMIHEPYTVDTLAALLAKIAVRDLMATPSRNQPPGPLRKGRGGKIRRW